MSTLHCEDWNHEGRALCGVPLNANERYWHTVHYLRRDGLAAMREEVHAYIDGARDTGMSDLCTLCHAIAGGDVNPSRLLALLTKLINARREAG